MKKLIESNSSEYLDNEKKKIRKKKQGDEEREREGKHAIKHEI